MWEYQRIAELNISIETLTNMGAQGWEHYLTIGNVNYFKRQIVVLKNAGKNKQ